MAVIALLPEIVLLVETIIVVCVVLCALSLCLRVRQTWQNKQERRRLTERVVWLHDLLQLLPSSAPAPAAVEEKEKSGGASAGAQAVRTVLARQMEATVSNVDRLVASASSCCCLLSFARSYKFARRLERANKGVDEVYTHLLHIVTRIDATHRLEQVLVGVMQQQQQLRSPC